LRDNPRINPHCFYPERKTTLLKAPNSNHFPEAAYFATIDVLQKFASDNTQGEK